MLVSIEVHSGLFFKREIKKASAEIPDDDFSVNGGEKEQEKIRETVITLLDALDYKNNPWAVPGRKMDKK